MIDTGSTPRFAPSEIVVLRGDRFTPEAGRLSTREEVLTSGVKVDARRLASAAMGTAVWAVHRSGAARLEVRVGKALFGLIKTQQLHLVPGTGASPFPAGSLEADLVQGAGPAPELQKLLEAYIGAEVHDPAARVLERIKDGLAARGLLLAEKRTRLLVITSTEYTLPAEPRAAVEAEPLEPVQAVLRDAEQREPELQKAVQKAIDTAWAMMTVSDD